MTARLIPVPLRQTFCWLRWVMSWKKERDALIAQTMAFVESVTGKTAETPGLNGGLALATAVELPALPELDLSPRPAPRPPAPVEPARIVELPPAAAAPHPRPRP